MKFKLVWFDSFGAKSSCTLVETPDVKILIDPGIAIMHPSFPASYVKKAYWKLKGKQEIIREGRKVDCIVISHYHWDHFMPDATEIYRNKLLLVKDPNMYINDSQRGRAFSFYSKLLDKFRGEKLSDFLNEPKVKVFRDIFDDLEEAKRKDFGAYNGRRRELMDKGRKWFKKRAEKWARSKWIPEMKLQDCEIRFAEGKTYKFGKTEVRFTGPLFHGIEYSRVGWVFSTIIENGGEKLLHSSDVEGFVSGEQVRFVRESKPDILICDGPMTYMLGNRFGEEDLENSLRNLASLVKAGFLSDLIIDHHLLRDLEWRARIQPLLDLAEGYGVRVSTAARFMGLEELLLEANRRKLYEEYPEI